MRLLIDLSNLAYRAAYKLSLSYKGQNTNIVYGVLKSLSSIAFDLEPSELVICWDGGSNKRKAIFPDYKGNRHKDPEFVEDLIRQLAILKQFFNVLPFVQCYENGVEADDVIAVVSKFLQLEEIGIVTSDSDLFQLCRPKRHCIIDPRSHAKVKLELKPEQFLAYRLLVGGKDNVPGVPMIGDKKARKLLDQFKTLDRILKHSKKADGLGSASHSDVLKVVTRNAELWDLSKPHVSEEEKVSLLNQYKYGRLSTKLDKPVLYDLCNDYGLNSLIRKFSGFCGSFRTLFRGDGVHKKAKKHSMDKANQKSHWAKRLRKVVTADTKGEGNKAGSIDGSKKRKQTGSTRQQPIYASRLRKVEVDGTATVSRSGNTKATVRSNQSRSTKRTMGGRNRGIEFADKGTATQRKVSANQKGRTENALFILSVLSSKDGWKWLKKQPTKKLKFVSSLIDTVEKEETTLIPKKQLEVLQVIYNAYCDEEPDWMK